MEEFVESKVLVEKLRLIALSMKGSLLEKLLSDAADRIEDLNDNANEWVQTFDMLNDRENRYHYLEYWREKTGKGDLWYPDGDQIYKDFWNLMHENEVLKKQVSDLKLKMSYMVDPNAIGDKHEMGW
jgi:hypothetical protein